MAFRLQFEDLSGNLLHERVLSDGELTIGRSAECGIALASSSVSREHARFFVHLGRCYVEDLRSANGVVVNGARIRGVQALNGPTIVVIGDHIVRCSPLGEAPVMAPRSEPSADFSHPALVRLDANPSGPRVVELRGSLVRVGRSSQADAQINDSSVSRIHAEVRFEGPSVIVVDLGSANGTFVNGARIAHPTAINETDVVQFGDIPTAFTHSPFTFDWRGVSPPALGGEPAQESSKLLWVAAVLAAAVIVCAVLVFVLARRQVDAAPDPLTVAAEATNAGDWSAAIAAYEAALQETPDSQAVLDALDRSRRELAAEEALAGCRSQLEIAQRLVAGTDTPTALDAFARARNCLQSVDTSSAAGTEAAGVLRAAVLPTLIELHRDAGARALAASQYDDALQHLRNARRLHSERASTPDTADSDLLASELRAAYVAAGSAAFQAQEWARAESLLSQAHAIVPLEGPDAAHLATARTNAARAR